MTYLILTQKQADAVRGRYGNNNMLYPGYAGGYYYLPTLVLENECFDSVKHILCNCEIVNEFPQEVEDEN